MTWQRKVILLPNEKIIRGRKKEKGHLGQTEILSFTIINDKEEVIGQGEYTEHTNVRGLQNSFILEYTKIDGFKFNERW